MQVFMKVLFRFGKGLAKAARWVCEGIVLML